MGLDPKYPDYEAGDECPVCVDILFGGKTPKYVEVDVSGVVLCPGAPDVKINGTFLMIQQTPCTWAVTLGGITWTWSLNVGQSIFAIISGPAFFFSSHVADDCYDAFVNQNGPCNWPLIAAQNGYATCWWGPTIGP
ncbi:hypothetical protein ES703_105754 [subsurface metagenome]